jgi:hypothetical protein
MSALLALDVADRAIGSFLVGRSIRHDLDRNAAQWFLSNDPNGAYGLAAAGGRTVWLRQVPPL